MEARQGLDAQAAEGMYETDERITVAEAPGLRVRQLALADGQCVPWHHHTRITDTFFCMSGPMEVLLRSPEAVHLLEPGDTLAVEPGRPHRVAPRPGVSCRFMIVQGVGTYDYVSDAGDGGAQADSSGVERGDASNC